MKRKQKQKPKQKIAAPARAHTPRVTSLSDFSAAMRPLVHSSRGAFLMILVVWAALYLPHLRTSPPWYNDETTIHKTAMDLVHGQMTLFGIVGTFWNPHNPYQPFYHFIVGLFGLATGGDILGSRFFNVLLALACAQSIYFFGRHSLGRMPSLFAALMFLTYTQNIIHFRMVYAHNLAGFGILLMTLFLLRPARLKNDFAAGAGLALAAGAHPLFIHAAFSGGLCRVKRPRSWLPLLVSAGIMVLISLGLSFFTHRQWLIDDLTLLKESFLTRAASDGAGTKSFQNLWFFLRQDWFHAVMIFGLLACFRRRLYPILIVGGFVLFMLVKNRQNLIVFYYQAIIILPTLCLTWAALFILFRRSLAKVCRLSRSHASAAATILFVLPALAFAQQFPHSLNGKIFAKNQFWATQSTKEVEAVAKWLNERTNPSDFVACGYTLTWLLKARSANYNQIATWYGLPTEGYEHGVEQDRFLYDESLENAKYAVVGDNEQKWAFGLPNVDKMVRKLVDGKWPVVWQSENFLILENPRHHIESPVFQLNQPSPAATTP